MDNRIFIKPAQPQGEPPLKVRKPVNGHLAAAGEWMPRDSYWLRRLTDGDVVEATAPAQDAPAQDAPKQTAIKAVK